MEEDRFDEEMRGIALTVEEVLNHTEDEEIVSRLEFVVSSLTNLQGFYREALEKRTAAPDEEEEFRLRYARLAGLSEQFTALGRKRPESSCGTFKAQQVNLVLLPLKEMLEKDMELELSLISEEGEQSYSDVSLLIQCYMDLCSAFALQHYNIKYDVRGHEVSSRGYGYGHR